MSLMVLAAKVKLLVSRTITFLLDAIPNGDAAKINGTILRCIIAGEVNALVGEDISFGMRKSKFFHDIIGGFVFHAGDKGNALLAPIGKEGEIDIAAVKNDNTALGEGEIGQRCSFAAFSSCISPSVIWAKTGK